MEHQHISPAGRDATAPAPDSAAAEQRPCPRLRHHAQARLIPDMNRLEYQALLADIQRRGLLTPLEITHDGVVLDGRHRLNAARQLGLTQVPVRVVEAEDELAYMLLAALRRRHLSTSQKAALAVELEECQQARAYGFRRQRANLRQFATTEVATLPPRGKSRDLPASLSGASPRSVQDAFTVREADSGLFEQVRGGELTVSVAARRVRRQRRQAALPPAPRLPRGPFELIYADPPWQLGNPDGAYAPENHYPTMPLEEIKAIQAPAAADALLFLWAVNCLLPEALEVLRAWGFTYKTNLCWDKGSIGLGVWTRNRHELLLVGRKGKYPPPAEELRPSSLFAAKRGRHSEKPQPVYELIERAYPSASKLELFARGTPRPGWAAWGNEVQAA